ncbi:MAG: hypothetical protein AB7I38_03905 [Dehalococcoidia bacterium]
MSRDPFPLAGDGRKHGRSLYTNAGCRCDVCREDHNRYQLDWKRRAAARTQAVGLPPTVQHGTENAFANHGCRCRLCLDAVAAVSRTKRAAAREGRLPPSVTHGTMSTYANYGCRCDACGEARRNADRRRAANRRPSPGGDTA